MANKLHVTCVVLAFSHIAYSIAGLKIFPDVTELVVDKNDSLTLICTNDEPIRWSYPKEVIRFKNKNITSWTENGTYFKSLTIFPTHYLDTGYYICQSENRASDIRQIYVYFPDDHNVIASGVFIINASTHGNVTIPCKPTSPNISVLLTKSNMAVEPIEKYDPKIGYVISTHSIIDSAVFRCFNSKNKREHTFTVKIYPPYNDSSNPRIEVTDSNFDYPIFEKQTAVLNCSVIASTNVGVKSLNWEFPQKVSKKILVENSAEVRHKNFNTYFRVLSIYNLTRNDEGNYTCKVVDGNFNIKVLTHFLRVEESDTLVLNITVPEESRVFTVESGRNSTVEFVAIVQSFPKHTVTKWYSPNGHEISSLFYQSTVIENGSEIKLKIKNIKIEDFGIYQLKISNGFLSNTVNFSLIVETRPEVDLHRFQMRLLKVNTPRDIECKIIGYPIPQIVWSAKTCADYPACENGTFQKIPPLMHQEKVTKPYEVTSTLHFESNRSMIVKCEANNSLGFSNISFPFLLTDYGYDVTVQFKDQSKLITVGDDVEILCAISKYNFVNNFEWTYAKNSTIRFFEKNRVIPSTEIQIQSSTTNFSYISILLIKNVQKSHQGMYICRATLNDGWRKNVTRRFPPNPKPPIILSSMMKNGIWQVHPGTLVNFLIQVDGIPPPNVAWYKNEKPVLLSERITLSGYNKKLSIANVSLEDEGLYSFIASNKAGNVTDRLQLLIRAQEENLYLKYILGVPIFISLLLIAIFFCMIRRLRKDKMKLQRILKEYGLHEDNRNTVASLDPKLDIAEQTFFIPYNKKYEFPKEKLKFGEVLGYGAFGMVKKAEADGIVVKGVKTTVAVKMAKRQHDSFCVKTLASELKIMIYLGQHHNVVNLLGACTKDLIKGELAVMVEYCKYGNLRDFLLKRRSKFANQIDENDEIDFTITAANCYENIPSIGKSSTKNKSELDEDTPLGSDGYLISNNLYDPEWRSNYMFDYDDVTNKTIKTIDLICWSFQIAHGMEYLASRKILHGDLAARNTLLAEGNIVKICDFGLAKNMYQSEQYQSSKTVFPVKWMAIESIRDRVFSTQSDVWSFGITMWEFFSLAVSPYPGLEQITNLYEKLESGYRMEKPKFATNKIYGLMKDCWNQDPNCRPSFTELCQKLGTFLEDSIQRQYTKLDELKVGRTTDDICGADNYLKILNSHIPNNSSESQVQHLYTNISPEAAENSGYLELTDVSGNTSTA